MNPVTLAVKNMFKRGSSTGFPLALNPTAGMTEPESPVDPSHLPHIYREPLWCYPSIPRFRDGRIIVEIGPGLGDFLFHLARENPQTLVCGIELMHGRFEKMIRRREQQELENIWLLQGDARRVLPEVFNKGVHELHIHFSDPWPKRKHHKHRLMQAPFIAACAKALLPGGHLYFTTDWPDYSEWTAKLMAQFCCPVLPVRGELVEPPLCPSIVRRAHDSGRTVGSPFFTSVYDPVIQFNLGDVFPSYFCKKWIAQGRVIQCQKYEKLGIKLGSRRASF